MLRSHTIFGTTRDLAGAAARHAAGLFLVGIDFLSSDDLAYFLSRTDTSANRFGEVAVLHA